MLSKLEWFIFLGKLFSAGAFLAHLRDFQSICPINVQSWMYCFLYLDTIYTNKKNKKL